MTDDIIKRLRERVDFERDGGMAGRWIKREELAALLDRLEAAERENEKLRAENEALAADARRYRFIRDTPWGPDLINVIQMQMNGKWDAAIDAAMAAEQSDAADR